MTNYQLSSRLSLKCIILLAGLVSFTVAIGLPRVNLGLSSFLDGGPLRPHPGFYWQQFVRYYTSSKLLDSDGKERLGLPSPPINSVATSLQLIYQRKQSLLPNAQAGFVVSLPLVLYSKIGDNSLIVSQDASIRALLSCGLKYSPPIVASQINLACAIKAS